MNFNLKFQESPIGLLISINNGDFIFSEELSLLSEEEISKRFSTEIIEINDLVCFPCGLIFNKGFVQSYKGLTLINARRKLKVWYGKSAQNQILSFLKSKKVVKSI
jgi:hypothetical protein